MGNVKSRAMILVNSILYDVLSLGPYENVQKLIVIDYSDCLIIKVMWTSHVIGEYYTPHDYFFTVQSMFFELSLLPVPEI